MEEVRPQMDGKEQDRAAQMSEGTAVGTERGGRSGHVQSTAFLEKSDGCFKSWVGILHKMLRTLK